MVSSCIVEVHPLVISVCVCVGVAVMHHYGFSPGFRRLRRTLQPVESPLPSRVPTVVYCGAPWASDGMLLLILASRNFILGSAVAVEIGCRWAAQRRSGGLCGVTTTRHQRWLSVSYRYLRGIYIGLILSLCLIEAYRCSCWPELARGLLVVVRSIMV